MRLPGDVENDIAVCGVPGVAVLFPSTRNKVDFDVAANGWFTGELNYRAAEIGAGFVVPKARMQDANFPAVGGLEAVGEETLVQPHPLKESFGRTLIRLLRESESRHVRGAPPEVWVCLGGGAKRVCGCGVQGRNPNNSHRRISRVKD